MSKSKVIFESTAYVVCLKPDVWLTVEKKTNRESKGGKFMPANHPQFKDWSDAWADLLDEKEGDDLCRGFLA
jgi:hypothetical protein